ncbi:putative F-box/LRR-repeat protein 16 [Sesbania bispinosa]|nr:putative F-box/LRR-repeat protein 16 [Sesbania bispinosa]
MVPTSPASSISSGKSLWSFPIPTNYKHDGPRHCSTTRMPYDMLTSDASILNTSEA